MQNKKTRLSLLVGSTAVIMIVLLFLWVLNLNESGSIQQMLHLCIFLLGGAAIITVAVFFLKGPALNVDGKVETGNILAMMVSVLVVILLAFSFASYSQKDQQIRYEMYGDMRQMISRLESAESSSEYADILNETVENSPSCEGAYILDANGRVYASSGAMLLAGREGMEEYDFPFINDSKVVFWVNESYRTHQIFAIWLELLTTLVISIFFSVEMVWGMIGLVTRKSSGHDGRPAALNFVRQTAFLFYFASRLSAAFIPIMAKNLNSSLFGMDANMAAGLPQSAETLLTCVAIFAATELLTRKGWKLPFMAGLGLVALGTLMSAFAPDLLIFIAARAVVGLGYGFCWMTLRNLALFGQNEKEKTWGFSMLNAGLYAGMNCGSALGSILAERFGYRNVFVMATVLTILCSLFIIRMENAVLPKSEQAKEKKERTPLKMRDRLQVVSFAIFMIAPSCIVGSYTSYYLPLYYDSIGRGVSDVGRAQLIYGLLIVYVGPWLSAKIIDKSENLVWANIAYNVIFSVGLLTAGLMGGVIASLAAVVLLGIADSFGFGVQNNYFLALPAVANMNSGKSLSYLSFLKKITEMLGPTAYSMAILLGYERGLVAMGALFLAAIVLYVVTGLPGKKRSVSA